MFTGRKTKQHKTRRMKKPKICYIEYIMEDFLDVKCLLTLKQRKFVLSHLQLDDLRFEQVDFQNCCTLNGKLLCIIDGERIHECWIYYPKQQRFEKHFLKAA